MSPEKLGHFHRVSRDQWKLAAFHRAPRGSMDSNHSLRWTRVGRMLLALGWWSWSYGKWRVHCQGRGYFVRSCRELGRYNQHGENIGYHVRRLLNLPCIDGRRWRRRHLCRTQHKFVSCPRRHDRNPVGGCWWWWRRLLQVRLPQG